MKHEDLLDLQLEWVRAADGKVAPLWAINVAMLGVLVAVSASGALTSRSPLPMLTGGILLIACILLALVNFPRTTGPAHSLIFFASIAEMSEIAFRSATIARTPEDAVTDIISQIYRNAQIARTKYRLLQGSTVCTFLALPLWLIVIYLRYMA